MSARLAVDLPPPEPFVDQMGWMMLQEDKDADKAIEFYKLNVSNFPGSYKAFDSLAGAYMAKDEGSLAIENYEKSLELNPDNQNAKKQLEELMGQK